MKYVVVSLFLILTFSSCSTDVKDLVCVEFENIELFKKEGDGHLTGTLKFDNPNSKTIQLQRADIEIFINQKSIGKIEEVIGEELKGKSPYDFNVNMTFNANDVYPGFLAKRLGSFGSSEVQVIAKGTIKSDLKGEKEDHVFDISKSLTIKR